MFQLLRNEENQQWNIFRLHSETNMLASHSLGSSSSKINSKDTENSTCWFCMCKRTESLYNHKIKFIFRIFPKRAKRRQRMLIFRELLWQQFNFKELVRQVARLHRLLKHFMSSICNWFSLSDTFSHVVGVFWKCTSLVVYFLCRVFPFRTVRLRYFSVPSGSNLQVWKFKSSVHLFAHQTFTHPSPVQ